MGKLKVTALIPFEWSDSTTLLQLDSSAQAPCAKTTVVAFVCMTADSFWVFAASDGEGDGLNFT